MDKSAGPAFHLACFGCAGGNGTICMDPESDTPPFPITLEELKKYIDDKHARRNPMILRTADVSMTPGVNKAGYWHSTPLCSGCKWSWLMTDTVDFIFGGPDAPCIF